jgi:hypothetical protein
MLLHRIQSLGEATQDLFSINDEKPIDRLCAIESDARDLYLYTFWGWRTYDDAEKSSSAHQLEITSQVLKAVVPTLVLSGSEKAVAGDFIVNTSEREADIRDALREEKYRIDIAF